MAVDTWITRAVIILGFLTAVITLWQLIRVKGKQEEIHVLVNSRLSAVVDRVAQLISVLKIHGIEIPDDPDNTPKGDT
jgi:hypothetical protein